MLYALRKIFALVATRLLTFLLLAAVLVLAVSLYLAGDFYFRDAERRAGQLGELVAARESRLTVVREELEAAADEAGRLLAETRRQVEKFSGELQDNYKALTSARERMRELRGWLLRLRAWFGSEEARAERAKLETAERQVAELEEQRDLVRGRLRAAEAREQELRPRLDQPDEALAREADRLEAEIAGYREEQTRFEEIAMQRRQLMDTTFLWLERGFKVALPAVLALAFAFFVLPWLIKVILYYAWAPLLQRAKPVVLDPPGESGVPQIGESQTALEVRVEAGEVLTLHHLYYQALDDELDKRTRYLFNWRYPFTSLACRLFLMTDVRPSSVPLGRITVSNQEDPTCELAVIQLRAGDALVLRPSHLVALKCSAHQRPAIRSHWRLGHLHAWITLQFRYFEFTGPCALVVRGQRGIRAERVQPQDVNGGRVRRTSQAATIGFTPRLSYFSRRAATFLSYFGGKNALFDDVFSGDGVFICQQISRQEGRFSPGAFWRRIGDVFSKLFGL